MTPTLTVTSTSTSQWKYIAEGGASLVCAYRGQPSGFTGRVLRLRKVDIPVPRPGRSPEAHQAYEQQVLIWRRDVISRLLPPGVLPAVELVHVEPAWLAQLAEEVEPHRPLERRLATRIDTNATTALLALDLVSGAAVAVEIKPKWGFLPAPDNLKPEAIDIKTQHCRTCMLKTIRAPVDVPFPLSQQHRFYCALDLFSGDEHRMRRALEGMWDEWVATGGRSNNFRVFMRGDRVHPNLTSLLLIAPTLDSVADPRTALVDRILPSLFASDILPRLKELQRKLDKDDIDGLCWLGSLIHSSANPFDEQPEPSADEWRDFVSAFLEGREPAEWGEAKLRYNILAYALSMVFKDCSLFVRMPLGELEFDSDGEFIGLEDEVPKVWVIDTDRKPVSRLDKWVKQDAEIVEAFVRTNANFECVE